MSRSPCVCFYNLRAPFRRGIRCSDAREIGGAAAEAKLFTRVADKCNNERVEVVQSKLNEGGLFTNQARVVFGAQE